jgi:hypothetical protein
MTRTTWIIVLVAGGVGLALIIGLLGGCNESEQEQQQSAVSELCSSLNSLGSDTAALMSLNPVSASKDDYESAVSDVEDDWDEVQSNASEVESTTMSLLSSSWDSFKQAVDDVPDDASVSDALQGIAQAGQQLQTSTASTLSAVQC